MQRLVNKKEAMQFLGGIESYGTFKKLVAKLGINPVMGNLFDIKAIESALDKRGDLINTLDDVDAIILGRIKQRGKDKSHVSGT